MQKQIGFILVLTVLLNCATCINWVATGNMSKDNLTQIWMFINTKFLTQWDYATISNTIGEPILISFATNLSNHLNDLWSPAWNVVLVYLNMVENSDSVLNGYAFRDHWLWYNGVTMKDGKFVTFIIWKDYNCAKWRTYQTLYSLQKSYDYSQDGVYMSVIDPALSSFLGLINEEDNIWVTSQYLIEGLTKHPMAKDMAFTVIMSQSTEVLYSGCFCAKDYLQRSYISLTSSHYQLGWGRFLLLQMR